MAVQLAGWRRAVVRVGFVVEGHSEKVLVESETFRRWLDKQELKLVDPVVVAGGQRQLEKGTTSGMGLASLLRKRSANLDRLVVLADLDPSETVPCITERRNRVDSEAIDLVVIARKAIESWFLADTRAMRSWTNDESYCETHPEATPNMPWDRMKEVGPVRRGRSKVLFAKRLITEHGFDVVQAAKHPRCPTARYFVERVSALARG